MSAPRPLHRIPGWEDALSSWLASVRSTPHAFGTHDCLLFAAGAVKVQTGADLAAGHRRKYKTEAGSVRYLRGLGFRSAEALVDSLLPAVPPAFAQRGDIVLVDGIPALCMGDHALMVGQRGEVEGLQRVPLGSWRKAWRVGERADV